MSSFDEELNKIKGNVENGVKSIQDLIDTYSSKLLEIEDRLEKEADREGLFGELAKLRSLRHQVKSRAMSIRHDLRRSLRDFRNEIRSEMVSEGGPKEAFEEVEGKLEEMEEYLEDKFDEIRDKLDSFSDRVQEVEEKVKDRIRDWKRGLRKAYVGGFSIPEIKLPEIKIPDVGRLIDESLSKAWTGVPSAIVSSVRLPQADLSLIDMLANAGVFRSRNEGIAFFAHRGIEASEEWLKKVKEKLDEIRKLQEEIGKVMGVASITEEKEKEPLKE